MAQLLIPRSQAELVAAAGAASVDAASVLQKFSSHSAFGFTPTACSCLHFPVTRSPRLAAELSPPRAVTAFKRASHAATAADAKSGNEQCSNVANLVDIALHSSIHAPGVGQLPVELPLLVLEEALYCSPAAQCALLWNVVDVRRSALTHTAVLEHSKANSRGKLALLRFSNSLLSRLSPAAQPVLCGRIQVFLANALPLSERSGVNPKGTFSAENVTAFDTPPAGLEEEPTWQQYTAFWGLHEFLAVPPRATASMDAWREFMACCEAVATVFEQFPHGKSSAEEDEAGSAAPTLDTATFFCPKYLTSFALFDLQKRDPVVQRQICIQLLIVLRFLAANPGSELQGVGIPAWCHSFSSRLGKVLAGTGPGSKALIRAVRRVLVQEESWSAWKAAGAKALERPANVAAAEQAQKALAAPATPVPDPFTPHHDDVDASFDAPDQKGSVASVGWAAQGLGLDWMAELRDSERSTKPTLRKHVDVLLAEMDPENPFRDADFKPESLESDKNWVWRGTRLLSEHSVSVLQRMPAQSFTATVLETFNVAPTSSDAKPQAAEPSASPASEGPEASPPPEASPSPDASPEASEQPAASPPAAEEGASGQDSAGAGSGSAEEGQGSGPAEGTGRSKQGGSKRHREEDAATESDEEGEVEVSPKRARGDGQKKPRRRKRK